MTESGSQEGQNQLHAVYFPVEDRFYRFWDTDWPISQLDFLRRIDHRYFAYQTQLHAGQWNQDSSQHAALALRTTFSHALETLFMLIGAAIQAPEYPTGWFIKCTNTQLANIVERIANQDALPNAHGRERLTWETTANVLFPFEHVSLDSQAHIEICTRIWRGLAGIWLDQNFRDEYNSIKHGLRLRSSPQFFALGKETTPGVPSQNMQLLHSHQTGSSFLRAKKVDRKKDQYFLQSQTVSWSADGIVKMMDLVVRSILNVTTYLRLRTDSSDHSPMLSVFSSDDAELWESTWSNSPRFSFALHSNIPIEFVDDVTQDDLKALYSAQYPRSDMSDT